MKNLILKLLNVKIMSRNDWDKLVDETISIAEMRKDLEKRGLVLTTKGRK